MKRGGLIDQDLVNLISEATYVDMNLLSVVGPGLWGNGRLLLLLLLLKGWGIGHERVRVGVVAEGCWGRWGRLLLLLLGRLLQLLLACSSRRLLSIGVRGDLIHHRLER
jgi:hypothetical protein